MKAYPFMWAKNKHIGEWQCVAKPSFISQLEGSAKLALMSAQSGATLAVGEACMVRGHVDGFGILDLIYRRRPSEITDSGGRPISIIEGYVLRKNDAGLVFCAEHFDAAQAKLQPLYERFKVATEWTTEAALHEYHIELHTISGSTPLTIIETMSRRIPPAAQKKRKIERTETQQVEHESLASAFIAAGKSMLSNGVSFVRNIIHSPSVQQPPPGFQEKHIARGSKLAPRSAEKRVLPQDRSPDSEDDPSRLK